MQDYGAEADQSFVLRSAKEIVI